MYYPYALRIALMYYPDIYYGCFYTTNSDPRSQLDAMYKCCCDIPWVSTSELQ